MAKLLLPGTPVVVGVGEVKLAEFLISNPSNQPLSTDLHFLGSLGAIDFGRGPSSSSHAIPVSLQPGEERVLQVPVSLNPRAATLPFLRYPIELFADGRRVTSSVILVAPPRMNAPAFAIVAFEVNAPSNAARIAVRTQPGRRYKLQRCQLGDDRLGWLDAPCVVVGENGDANPEFDGARGPVELVVDLDVGGGEQLFRVAELEE